MTFSNLKGRDTCLQEFLVKLEALKMETDIFLEIGRQELVPSSEALVKMLGEECYGSHSRL